MGDNIHLSMKFLHASLFILVGLRQVAGDTKCYGAKIVNGATAYSNFYESGEGNELVLTCLQDTDADEGDEPDDSATDDYVLSPATAGSWKAECGTSSGATQNTYTFTNNAVNTNPNAPPTCVQDKIKNCYNAGIPNAKPKAGGNAFVLDSKNAATTETILCNTGYTPA